MGNPIQPSGGQANYNQTDKVESDPIKTIQSAFESELQCQICYEIFIKPIVLNCAHTFCATCIHIWTKRVNRCPVCRMNIKSKSHCLTLNVFIDKMMQFMPEDVITRRNLSIEERQKDAEEMNMNRGNTEGSDGMIGELDYFSENQDEEIDEDVIVQEADMFRMNLHDTVVSMGGLNPLIRYMLPPMGEHRL
ncbi:Hypothetical protein CINCED_3A005786 [Cinara cedri]|nr:Hypothetical protein CINCED_3A005786 [Cinara cedri]